MLGCNKCGHIWDNCECEDLDVMGADRDMFEVDVNPHYKQGQIQPIDLIKDMGDLEPFCLGNAIKYIVRCRHKGSKKQDIEKAIDYLSMVLKEL